MKRRWPKSEKKRALLRYQLAAAADYKQAMRARDGSQGAASAMRHIVKDGKPVSNADTLSAEVEV